MKYLSTLETMFFAVEDEVKTVVTGIVEDRNGIEGNLFEIFHILLLVGRTNLTIWCRLNSADYLPCIFSVHGRNQIPELRSLHMECYFRLV